MEHRDPREDEECPSGEGRPTGAGETEAVRPERHAAWNELFFDLVVVAGVGQLAHLLRGTPTLGDIGIYATLYVAFWIAWATFAVYGDIAAGRTRTGNLLAAMLGMAVMTASVPGILGSHTEAFVIAYVLLRWFGGRVWERTQIVTDWPLARYGIGSIPWVASLFTPEPWRYWLWAGGTLIDLVLLYGVSPELIMKDASAKADHVMETRGPRGRRGWRAGRSGKRSGGTSPLPAHTPAPERSGSRPHKEGTRPAITLQEARTDTSHLGERLGLYVIIVLGEGIIQVIDAMAEHEHWDVPLILTSLGAFALLVGIWYLSLLYGFDGVPQLRENSLATRHTMLLHATLTAGLAALAGALGVTVEHAGGTLPTGTRALLCGAIALYFAVGIVASLRSRPATAWLLGFALPCLLMPGVMVLLGDRVPTVVLVWMLALAVLWQTSYSPSRGEHGFRLRLPPRGPNALGRRAPHTNERGGKRGAG